MFVSTTFIYNNISNMFKYCMGYGRNVPSCHVGKVCIIIYGYFIFLTYGKIGCEFGTHLWTFKDSFRFGFKYFL
jgi:hypothetical protein